MRGWRGKTLGQDGFEIFRKRLEVVKGKNKQEQREKGGGGV